MKDLTEDILNYIQMPNLGALMISGVWGCGKTYHLDNVVFPKLRKEKYIPIRVSLFGITDINMLPSKILDAFLDANKDAQSTDESLWQRAKNTLGKTLKVAKEKVSSLKILSKYFDLEKLIGNNNEFYYKFIPSDRAILVFDDLERAVKSINIYTLLGTINNLIEKNNYKVIVVSNNSYLDESEKDNLVFKEKVIEKTLIFEPDIMSIYNKLLENGIFTDDFRKLMSTDDFLKIINPEVYSKESIKNDLKNIRILKFALSHFFKIFSCLYERKEIQSDDDFKSFLLSLWASSVGLSIEYKRNRITNQDQKAFSEYVEINPFPIDLGVSDINSNNEGDGQKQKELSSTDKINNLYEDYVKANGLRVITSVELFNLITSGYSLDETKLIETWTNYKSDIQLNKKSPANLLFDKFAQFWTFSNEEMSDNLNQLVSYVENGDFNSNIAYTNVASFLFHFRLLTNYSEDELKDKFKKGIDKMYSTLQDANHFQFLKRELNLVDFSTFHKNQWICEYEKNKIEEIEKDNLKRDIEDVNKQFCSSMADFNKRLMPNYAEGNTPDFIDVPILSYIEKDVIIKKMQRITPNEVFLLKEILKFRFLESDNAKRKIQELCFVENIRAGILQRENEKKQFVDYMIGDGLMPIIEQISQNCKNF